MEFKPTKAQQLMLDNPGRFATIRRHRMSILEMMARERVRVVIGKGKGGQGGASRVGYISACDAASLATGSISIRSVMGIAVDDVSNVTFINPAQGRVSTHVPFELMYGASEATINDEYRLMDRWGRARMRLFGAQY